MNILLSGTSRSFIIGIAAGGAALAASYFLRTFAGGLFVPELAAQVLFSITPGSVESQAISTLGEMAKNLAFAIAVIGSLILYGGIGILLHKTYGRLALRGGERGSGSGMCLRGRARRPGGCGLLGQGGVPLRAITGVGGARDHGRHHRRGVRVRRVEQRRLWAGRSRAGAGVGISLHLLARPGWAGDGGDPRAWLRGA